MHAELSSGADPPAHLRAGAAAGAAGPSEGIGAAAARQEPRELAQRGDASAGGAPGGRGSGESGWGRAHELGAKHGDSPGSGQPKFRQQPRRAARRRGRGGDGGDWGLAALVNSAVAGGQALIVLAAVLVFAFWSMGRRRRRMVSSGLGVLGHMAPISPRSARRGAWLRAFGLGSREAGRDV